MPASTQTRIRWAAIRRIVRGRAVWLFDMRSGQPFFLPTAAIPVRGARAGRAVGPASPASSCSHDRGPARVAAVRRVSLARHYARWQ